MLGDGFGHSISLLAFRVSQVIRRSFLTFVRVFSVVPSSTHVVGFFSNQDFLTFIFGHSFWSLIRRYRFTGSYHRGLSIMGHHFLGGIQIEAGISSYTVFVFFTLSSSFRQVFSFTRFGISTMGIHVTFSFSLGIRFNQGNVSGKNTSTIGSTKGLMSTATRLTANVGRHVGNFGYQPSDLLLGISQGTTAIILGHGTIIFFGNRISFITGSNRDFVSTIISSFPSRVIRTLQAYQPSMRPQTFSSHFGSFGGLSLTNVVFFDFFFFSFFGLFFVDRFYFPLYGYVSYPFCSSFSFLKWGVVISNLASVFPTLVQGEHNYLVDYHTVSFGPKIIGGIYALS